MRIVDVRELSVPLQADIANALVNFSEHTVSGFALLSAWGFWRGGNIFNRDVVVSMETTAPAAKA